MGYRDEDEGDQCVVVLYGRAADIFAARTLFAAADALGARLLPKGNRSWRVSWWKGFQFGIEEALRVARNEFVTETQGAGIVLADRTRVLAMSSVGKVHHYVAGTSMPILRRLHMPAGNEPDEGLPLAGALSPLVFAVSSHEPHVRVHC